MKADTDGVSVVIAGSWNSRIFSPDWITKNLTNSEEISVELPLGNPTLPPRLGFDNIKLIVTHNKLIVKPDDGLEDTMQRAYQIAKKSVSILTHTPISAVGVNFNFKEDNLTESLAKAFTLNDADEISNVSDAIDYTTIKRGLIIGDMYLNLSLHLKNMETSTIAININQPVQTSQEALDFFENHDMTSLQKFVVDFLTKTYHLELTE